MFLSTMFLFRLNGKQIFKWESTFLYYYVWLTGGCPYHPMAQITPLSPNIQKYFFYAHGKSFGDMRHRAGWG